MKKKRRLEGEKDAADGIEDGKDGGKRREKVEERGGR